MKKLLLVCAVFLIASGFTKEEIASQVDETIITEFKTEMAQLKVQQISPAEIVERVQNHDYEGVKQYLDNGGKPNMRWANNTLLMIAAKRGYTDICELLLSYYTKKMKEDYAKRMYEIGEKNKNIIDETNEVGWTALMFAAQNNQGKTVKFLIEKGADKNHKTTSFLETVIGVAAINCANDSIKALLEKGANIEQKGDATSYTPLMSAIASQEVDDELKILATVKLLNSKGADVNARSNYGETPLMIAAAKGYYSIVKFLLSDERREQGNGDKIDVNAENLEGDTAYKYAKNNGHPKTADFIKRYGGK